MKTNKIILLLALLMLLSCPSESPMWERIYQIENNSGYDIVVRAFKNYTGSGSYEDIIITDGDLYKGNLTSGSNFDYINNSDNLQPTSSFDFIRFILVFNNERFMIHSVDFDNNNSIFSDPVDRNLLRGGSYNHIGNDVYEFILTEQDYNNAAPCDGDCLD